MAPTRCSGWSNTPPTAVAQFPFGLLGTPPRREGPQRTTLTCHTTCPPYVVMPASDRSEHPTRRSNELWQTDFTYLRVGGWGWYESAAEQALQRERERPGANIVERIAVGQAGVLRVKRVNRVSAGVFDFVHDRISQLQAQ